MYQINPNELDRRSRGLAICVGFLMLVLLLSFFRAQVLSGHEFALEAESNRVRILPVPAPRGAILDRNGVLVSENVPTYSVSILPDSEEKVRSRLLQLQPFLDLSLDQVDILIARSQTQRHFPTLVRRNVSFDEIASIEERRGELPGLLIENEPRRRYNGDESLGHLVGYVSEISSAELETSAFEDYEAGMIIGKDGLEREYESVLQGQRGVRFVEVDALGRVIGSFAGDRSIDPLPGQDIQLHLDLGLQQYIHEIFPDSMRGAVVALDVEEGGILALYSAPSFDPNSFVEGISRERWEELNTDPDRPLFNRAVVGRYPPASTWKLATAAIGLDQGLVSAGEHMPVQCTGSFRFQNVVRRCWNPDGHGSLDLAEAVAHSCNVYFYQLGARIGLENLVKEGTRLGFGTESGIDLPRESSGIFPASLEFWERRFGYKPYENEVLSLSIGQGPNDQTPLKMAQFYLGIARGGDAPTPQLRRTTKPLETSWELDLSEAHHAELLEGLRQVTRAGGTGFMSSLEHWDFIGKTGTAQHSLGSGRPSHAWFAGMAGPWGADPEVVLVVIVEEGASGSAMAAPIAAKAADFFLRNKYGIPVDSIQTLREHLESGTPAPWARWSADDQGVSPIGRDQ